MSGDVADTYATSAYVSQQCVTSSTGTTFAVSGNVADTYVTSSTGTTFAVSGDLTDTYVTSSFIDDNFGAFLSNDAVDFAVSGDVADTYATSSTVSELPVSSDIALTYVISSTFANLGSVRIVGGTSYIVFASGDAGISSEITHNISAQAPTTVVTTIEASSWIGSILVHNITESSFWVRTSEPPIVAASSETVSAKVHWIALLTSW